MQPSEKHTFPIPLKDLGKQCHRTGTPQHQCRQGWVSIVPTRTWEAAQEPVPPETACPDESSSSPPLPCLFTPTSLPEAALAPGTPTGFLRDAGCPEALYTHFRLTSTLGQVLPEGHSDTGGLAKQQIMWKDNVLNPDRFPLNFKTPQCSEPQPSRVWAFRALVIDSPRNEHAARSCDFGGQTPEGRGTGNMRRAGCPR